VKYPQGLRQPLGTSQADNLIIRGKHMDNLSQLANLVKKRNSLELEITALTDRPAEIGHLGEYIASKIFDIRLEISASHKSTDGRFKSSSLKGCSVNIKWYTQQKGLLDMTPNSLPDYYLGMTGPKSGAMSSRGQTHAWVIDSVFLFEAQALVHELKQNGVKIGMATSFRQYLWTKAEIYPAQNNDALNLSADQLAALAVFNPVAGA
jgi:hypothetical protein